MPGKRNDSQSVEAFSAPRELLRDAQLEAKRRRMSKSGFYRYCLAKELGRDEDQALRIAEHAGAGNFQIINAGRIEKVQTTFPSTSQDAPAVAKYPKPKQGKKPKQKNE